MQIDNTLRQKLTDIVRATKAEKSPGMSLPYAALQDQTIFDFEQELFFGAPWQALCFDADLATPGTRRVSMLGRTPILVVRGHDNEVRGFVNVCRHRAYPVAEADGVSALLLCRYHCWSYDLSGRLKRAPEAENSEGFDKAAYGLMPIAIAVWRGVVFVNADPAAPALCDAHPALDRFGAEVGFDLSGYRPFRTLTMEMASDWKLVIDNAIECYHCASMHAKTLTCLYETAGFGGARWGGAVRHSFARMAGGRGRHDCIQIFPGTYLVSDAVIGIVGRFVPLGPRTTKLEFRFAAAPGVDPSEAERFADIWTETLAEDREVLARQSVGIASGRLTAGYLVEGPESCLRHTRAIIAEKYEDALAGMPPG